MSVTQDLFLLECETYEDYLNTFITRNDVRFLRSMRFCRMLVELGYRSQSEIYTPEQFELHKAAVLESLWPIKKLAVFFSEGRHITDPVLLEIAVREKLNKQKTISTILFLRHRLKSGFEVSGYIDLEESFRHANMHMEHAIDWEGVFEGRVTLRPKPHDLSFLDWHTNTVICNESDNYAVHHDVDYGLIFMHRGDHKKICVDITRELYSRNCVRAMHYSDRYGHAVFYDHVVRKKA